MLDVIIDSLLDTAKLLPFLYLTYLFMEFLEHKSGGAAEAWLRRSGKIGPLIGGALGIVPQCGFSVAATGLYTGRIITAGTLIAVYLSTSDEMLPILISEGAPALFVLKILLTKLAIGIIFGFLTDLMFRVLKRGGEKDSPKIEELCEKEKCHCEGHFALSALKHTLHVVIFILAFSFILNTVIYLIGEETISAFVLDKPLLGNIIASIVGMIPNCASSVILTELYLENVISVGAMLSGLLVNAGIGLAVLFKNNRPIKDSFMILTILFVIGVTAGTIIDITPLSDLLEIAA